MVDENIRKLREIEGHLVDPELAIQIFEVFPDSVVIVDDRGIIQLVNRQTELLFGYHRTELFDQPIEMLVPQDIRTEHVKYRDNYFSDPRVRPMGAGLSLKAITKNGRQFAVEINLSPLPTRTHGPFVVAVVRKVKE